MDFNREYFNFVVLHTGVCNITSHKSVNNKVKFCIKLLGTVQSRRYEKYHNYAYRTCSLHVEICITDSNEI